MLTKRAVAGYTGKYKDMLPPFMHISRQIFNKKADVERFSEMSMTAA